MKSPLFGELRKTDYDAEWLESQPIEIPYLDNSRLIITLVDTDDDFIKKAEEAFRNFLNLNPSDRENDSSKVLEYYNEVLNAGYTEELSIDNDSDIWKYVNFNAITIVNWSQDETIYLLVSCGCEWEIEHGLELSFKNGERLVKANAHGDDIEE